jgi:YHS domain-containing protein
MLLSWSLRLLLILLVLRLVWRFVAGLIDGVAGAPGRQVRGQQQAVPLVKDPVCGTYVVKDRALSAYAGGETGWFCSERCRDQWRESRAGTRSA